MTEQHDSNATDGCDGRPDGHELPAEVVEEIERLAGLERKATDEREREQYEERRAASLSDHGFTSRIRADENGDVLVLHPDAWHDDGVVRVDRIEDLSRAIEIPLEGSGEPDEWSTVDAANRALVAAVREEHGEIHGDNAAALADFMGNHYARPIESATSEALEEFCSEYFVRNAWPSEKQRESIETSI